MTAAAVACPAGFAGCDCCDNSPDWIAHMSALGVEVPSRMSFCECHDCYRCGHIDCDCS